jgi:signal transduction histidine kinase/CheY-like chemotaxis protein
MGLASMRSARECEEEESMPTDEIEVLKRRLERERAARKQAETLLEDKSRELYQTNQELRNLADHLEELVQERTKELAQARDQALEANRAKSVFLANMSHELRTPLNAILGFTQLMMRDQGVSAEYRENLDVIIRSGEHLLGLINDVLEMSKIEAGQHTLNAENFDLYYMLNGLEDMFRLRASDKKLTLLFDLAEDVPQYVRTDPNKLRQVLINLLGNAVKFTHEGGVTLRCRSAPLSLTEDENLVIKQGAWLFFEVEDTGPGIAENELEELFEAFKQTATGRQMQEGSGLGLAISHMFVHLLGGDLTVCSTVGQGSVFKFDIQVQCAAVADVPVSQPRQRVIGLEPDQPSYRILIVEDRLENRRLLVKLLEPIGFEVREAVNGQEGIEIWEAWDPHLVWMDMRMPVMDGYEATKRIKSTTKGQATVVVALTASVFEEQRTVVLSAGCDDFVRKPFRDKDIFDVLHRHLGVRFLYAGQDQETATPRHDSMPKDLTPTALRNLPAQWLSDMHQAANRADMDRMLSLLTDIETDYAQLAQELQTLIQDFRLDELIALTDTREKS